MSEKLVASRSGKIIFGVIAGLAVLGVLAVLLLWGMLASLGGYTPPP